MRTGLGSALRPESNATRALRASTLYNNIPKGQRQVYLPNHVIRFVRPNSWQPPTLATFVVPLKFNKLDMRDYLFNVYGTRVRGVRAFVRAFGLQRRPDGKKYRPRPQKMMTCVLEQPFVWPDPPAKPKISARPKPAKAKQAKAKAEGEEEEEGGKEEVADRALDEEEGGDRKPWDYAVWKRGQIAAEQRDKLSPQMLMSKKPPLRKRQDPELGWDMLREQAQALLQGQVRWGERAPATRQKRAP